MCASPLWCPFATSQLRPLRALLEQIARPQASPQRGSTSDRVAEHGRRDALSRQEEGRGGQAYRARGQRKGCRVSPAPAEPVFLPEPCRQEARRREPVSRCEEAK